MRMGLSVVQGQMVYHVEALSYQIGFCHVDFRGVAPVQIQHLHINL